MPTGADRQTMDAHGGLGLGGYGGGGGSTVPSQENSLILCSSLLPLKHC